MARRTKGASRARTRELQEREAADVRVPDHADVCVVGGGAAGLVASICAAEAGAHTVVLERSAACGQTILATGNGRCNFANKHLDPALYNDPAFVSAVCGSNWLEDVLAFFDQSGLAWGEEAQGRLYPLSRQAASVREVLLTRARRAGVALAPLREVVDLSPAPGGMRVRYAEGFADKREHELVATAVVVATGGGATSSCAKLGLAMGTPQPLLCPLACSGPALEQLDGRRVHAHVRLLRDGREVMRESGEVLFRSYGLSGIVIFDVSRHAAPHDVIELDLLGDLEDTQATRLATHTLVGILDPVIAQALQAHAGSAAQTLELARHLRYQVEGTTETRLSQVTRDGLKVDQFDPATLACTSIPGLYACGEALDVDGPCGGFNLAWAWKSGLIAGTAAAHL